MATASGHFLYVIVGYPIANFPILFLAFILFFVIIGRSFENEIIHRISLNWDILNIVIVFLSVRGREAKTFDFNQAGIKPNYETFSFVSFLYKMGESVFSDLLTEIIYNFYYRV